MFLFYGLFLFSSKRDTVGKVADKNLKSCHFTLEVLSIEEHIALHGNLLTVGHITQSPTIVINREHIGRNGEVLRTVGAPKISVTLAGT